MLFFIALNILSDLKGVINPSRLITPKLNIFIPLLFVFRTGEISAIGLLVSVHMY